MNQEFHEPRVQLLQVLAIPAVIQNMKYISIGKVTLDQHQLLVWNVLKETHILREDLVEYLWYTHGEA